MPSVNALRKKTKIGENLYQQKLGIQNQARKLQSLHP